VQAFAVAPTQKQLLQTMVEKSSCIIVLSNAVGAVVVTVVVSVAVVSICLL